MYMLPASRASPTCEPAADSTICAICLDVVPEASGRALKCAHVYHRKCIARWLDMAPEPRCPQCATPVPGMTRKPIRHVEEQMREAEEQLRTIRRINQQAEADMEALEQALRDAEHETQSRSRCTQERYRTHAIEQRASERMATAERHMGALLEGLHAAESSLPADISAAAELRGVGRPTLEGSDASRTRSARAGSAVGLLRGEPQPVGESLAAWVAAQERASPRLTSPRVARDASVAAAYRTSSRGARDGLAAAQWLPAHQGSRGAGGERSLRGQSHRASRPLDHRAAHVTWHEHGRSEERDARAAVQQAQAAVRVAGRGVPRVTRPSKRPDARMLVGTPTGGVRRW